MDSIILQFHRACGFYGLFQNKLVMNLLSTHPDLVHTIHNGTSALHKAVMHYSRIELVRILLSYGADPFLPTNWGSNVFDIGPIKGEYGLQIINILNENAGEKERAYLVYKGFAIYGKEHVIFKQRLPEIKFNHCAKKHVVVKRVLESAWSRSNYDVFNELMGYLK